MAEQDGRYESVADILQRILGCPPHLLAELSPKQIAALHLYKHKLLAATNRLYMTLPAESADPILTRVFKEVAPDLP
jgi:hypothetical protein